MGWSFSNGYGQYFWHRHFSTYGLDCGKFFTCLLLIFQGTAGIAHSILLLIICTALTLITVFSAIGICDRCRIEAGGIYSLISHVLGGQIGGAVGLLYAFGQVKSHFFDELDLGGGYWTCRCWFW